MADPRGFLNYRRVDAPKRPKPERVADWGNVYQDQTAKALTDETRTQAARCMDCGIPF
ncbi:MAG: glutamate synthase small chain, partial [Pseudonocardiales bacterium]|nr:glutamate synthase small chain [Pseudonocardiales bacterium]